MKINNIEKLGVGLSPLGFGGMRMPFIGNEPDMKQIEQMFDTCIRGGVNYFDTAYFYHDGRSEEILGACLSRYPRDSFFVADKLPLWECKEAGDMTAIFNNQKSRLRVDCIDFYLIHALGAGGWEKAKQLGAYEFQKRLKEQGLCKFIGFSFHDSSQALEKILDESDYDFVQIQMNYYDAQGDAYACYELLRDRCIPIIIMEPVRGGALADPIHEVRELFSKADKNASPTSWALRYCGSLPGVINILSGMSTLAQCEENIGIFDDFKPLDVMESVIVGEAVKLINQAGQTGCTGCRYCVDCPSGVDIPRMLGMLDEYKKLNAGPQFLWHYGEAKRAGTDDGKCTRCMVCVERCPQKINVPDVLRDIGELAKAFKQQRCDSDGK